MSPRKEVASCSRVRAKKKEVEFSENGVGGKSGHKSTPRSCRKDSGLAHQARELVGRPGPNRIPGRRVDSQIRARGEPESEPRTPVMGTGFTNRQVDSAARPLRNRVPAVGAGLVGRRPLRRSALEISLPSSGNKSVFVGFVLALDELFAEGARRPTPRRAAPGAHGMVGSVALRLHRVHERGDVQTVLEANRALPLRRQRPCRGAGARPLRDRFRRRRFRWRGLR